MPARGGHKGERDPRVAAGGLHQFPAGEQAALFGVPHHGRADAALHTVGGVAPFDLGQNRGLAAIGDPVQAHQRGAAESLTVGEVLRYVEGPQEGRSRDRRAGAATPFSDMWEQVDQAISGVIDKTTFADLRRAWQEKQNKYVLNWEI